MNTLSNSKSAYRMNHKNADRDGIGQEKGRFRSLSILPYLPYNEGMKLKGKKGKDELSSTISSMATTAF